MPELSAHLDGSGAPDFPIGSAHALIAGYCAGWQVSVTREPEREGNFKLLQGHDEVWVMSFRKPGNGWRAFGRFVDQGLFVAIDAHSRDALGGYANYNNVAAGIPDLWDRLLPDMQPMRAPSLSQYFGSVVWDMDEESK